MGPEQPGAQTQLTDDQIVAAMKERGLSMEGSADAPPMGDDEKVAGVFEEMGGLQTPEGLSEDEAKIAEAELQKDTKIAVYQAEKEVAAIYPEVSETQKFELAKYFLAGKLTEGLKLAKELSKAEIEKDAEQTDKGGDLHVENESTAKNTKQQGNIASVSDLFGSGGMLSRVKRFGS